MAGLLIQVRTRPSISFRCRVGVAESLSSSSLHTYVTKYQQPKREEPKTPEKPEERNWLQKLLIKDRSDLYKRPSDEEIRRKKLPPNTPNLMQRLKRSSTHMFYESDPKGGYYLGKTGTWRDYAEDVDTKTALKISYNYLKENFAMLKEELKEDKFKDDPRPNDTRVVWKFDSEEALKKQWVTTADSDWGEGYSSCSLSLSPSGKTALFSGELSTRVPQDGRLVKAGYCTLNSVKQRRAFNRYKDLEFWMFSDLVLRVRGDGRRYRIILQTPEFFDLTWFQLYSFPLFTRGGPYWQEVKIPFSKFYFAYRGKIPDDQKRVDLGLVKSVGITLADQTDGPFSLEIDYIGLYLRRFEAIEKFRYESYYFPERNFNRP